MDKIAIALLGLFAATAAQAQTLPQLPTATTPLTGSELMYVVQGGVSKQVPSGSLPFNISALLNQSVNLGTGSLTANGGINTTGGGSLAGTFTGSPTFSGNLSLTGSGTALAVTNNATIGGTLGVTGAATLSGGGTLTGTFAGAATFSGGLTFLNLNTFNGQTRALSGSSTYTVLNGTVTYTGSSTGTNYAYHFDGEDHYDSTGATNGSYTFYASNVAGAGAGGSHTTLFANETVNGSGITDGLAYVGAQLQAQASVNVGGTSGTPLGYLYGAYSETLLKSGATYWYEAANEFDIAANSGSSYGQVSGLQIVLLGTHAVHGSNNLDTAFSLGSRLGITTGWDYGFRIGNNALPAPFISTSTLFFVDAGQTGTTTIANGFDISNYTYTGNSWNDGHVAFDGSGETNLNSVTALALAATDGFMDMPATAGIPTGAPAAFSALSHCAIDTTNGYLNCYYGAAWHKIAFGSGAG